MLEPSARFDGSVRSVRTVLSIQLCLNLIPLAQVMSDRTNGVEPQHVTSVTDVGDERYRQCWKFFPSWKLAE